MNICNFLRNKDSEVKIPVTNIKSLRLIFPAEEIVNLSRGIDRTEYLPTRYYETPSGIWSTNDANLLRLLHNDFPFILEKIAKLSMNTEFVAISTNYGNNPYYCFRKSLYKGSIGRIFHLSQENLNELHSGLSIISNSNGLQIHPVRVKFSLSDASTVNADGRKLPDEAMILTAPAIIWEGKFVGWERYARETYDCRHILKLQYPKKDEYDTEFERIRSEIQRLQQLWEDRDTYVKEVLSLAESIGYAEYERLLLGITSDSKDRYLVVSSLKGTAKDVAIKLKAEHPKIEAAFQINEGGGTGIITGTLSNYKVLGPSSYRRGRVLCCLLIESKDIEDGETFSNLSATI